ncbi:hypothetical protein NQ314_015338 [Rhamnusium bicolor]|uniref:Methylosome subunit pICln n=1 Tax=Rhamnusium bicolor TaxID=1586634 RepID=A0AAV8WYL7_9CUCU|nr:hypothetical protein NQ314_015338 [Rhamnusium bicolor]
MVIINSFRHPESNIRYEQRNVRAILDKKDLGLGTLFISESTLGWQQKDDIGFSIGYQDISLHAISKDTNVYPRECLYIIIDSHIHMPGDSSPQNIESSEDSDVESEPDLSELLLVPEENAATIPAIYEALKVCQELNPDPNDIDDEEDDNLYVDAEDEMDEGDYEVRERGGGDAVRHDACEALSKQFPDIIKALNHNASDPTEKSATKSKARGLVQKPNKFETAILAKLWTFILA